MRLIHPTFLRYPATTADAFYVRELSKAFTKILGERYFFIVGKNNSSELDGVPHKALNFKKVSFRPAYYFFWLMFLVAFREGWGQNRVFFSNDTFLLRVLIVLRFVLFFRYKICTDWHMFENKRKEKFICRYADVHITTTDYLRRRIINIGIVNPKNIHVVYGGVYIHRLYDDKVKLRQELGLPIDKTLVSYAGFFKTLGKEKGIRTMIESLNFLKEENVAMVFVGAKPEEIKEYKEYAEKLVCRGECIFIERVDSSILYKYQQAMDALVIPYPDEPHFRDSGFPMKTYEYMASGVPIIYSNLEIMGEVLRECAFSFDPGNPENLAKVIKKDIKSDLAKKMTKKAQEKVSMLTWEDKARKIISHLVL